MNWQNDDYCDWGYRNFPNIKDRIDPPDPLLPDPVEEDMEDIIDFLCSLDSDDEWEREEMKEITKIIHSWIKKQNEVRAKLGKKVWKI